MLAAYWQSLGILLAQWIPICGLIFFAMRMGVLHGIRAYEAQQRLLSVRRTSDKQKDFEKDAEERRRQLAG